MAEVVIRPTVKFVKAGYSIIFLLIVAAGILQVNFLAPEQPPWLPLVTGLLLLWPLQRHLSRRLTKATITGDKLRYETGLLSKSTRSIQLSKIQDVRVDQSLSQRLFDVGNISIETAGEASRLTMENIDNPQVVADEVMRAAQKNPKRSI